MKTDQERAHPVSPLQRELIEILQQASLFSGLDESTMLEVIRRGRLRLFAAEQTIFMQGDSATGLHVVVHGQGEGVQELAQGPGADPDDHGPGRTGGGGGRALRRSLSGQRRDPGDHGDLLHPPRGFLDLIRSEPEVALRLLAALSARLRSFASLIEDLSLKGVTERLAVLSALAGARVPRTSRPSSWRSRRASWPPRWAPCPRRCPAPSSS